MKYFLIILTLTLFSCSFSTDISYRLDEEDEYIRGDGFMISCKKQDNFFIIGTYTPGSWGERFYYTCLGGQKTDRKLKINNIDLLFLETLDTLTLHEKNQKNYYYTSPNLDNILESNEQIKVSVFITDSLTQKNETKEFILTQRKETYSTGTWMH